jgi:isopentenyl-diphosphate delta-isomerase
VDIVDEKGNFIKVVSKQQAHEKGLLHKTVISQLVDSNGRWLLIKPSKGRQDEGQYVSPMGGHVSAGETDVQALKREMNEELGLRGDIKYELIGKTIFNRFVIGRQENHFFIMYKSYSNKEPILSHEAESCKYFTEEELKRELKENPELFGDAFHFVAKKFHPFLYE